MIPAQPLAPAWLDAIDATARTLLGSRDRTGNALVEEVKALSQIYTRERSQLATQADPIAGRLRFFLPRDLPKVEGPLSDLSRQGLLPRASTWRVLDLGAGLGTTTLGTASFAKRAGVESLHVTAVEQDDIGLRILESLARACGHAALAEHTVPIALNVDHSDMTTVTDRYDGPFDLILMGLSLNELFNDRATVERRVAYLQRLRSLLSKDGSIVLVEPALRTTSRDLQQVRNFLQERGVHIAAPCTHTETCPLLRRERDWCHQQLSVPLPPPLVPVAKQAGLRFERLTWSHLVIHAGPSRPSTANWRVVGGPIVTKGRVEWQVCGEPGLARVARLDRHKAPEHPLNDVGRGALLQIDPIPNDGQLVRADKVTIAVV
ncbi:MAG: ribosomal protein RSM22 (predicted rRNA methylase) [Myxococcota bacterium]|jgi:ribosomal protein RSM22 (predicted rRNA methylase)